MAVAVRINRRMRARPPPPDGDDRRGDDGDDNGDDAGDEVDGTAAAAPAAAAVLPMDGFHYTRSRMKAMGESPLREHGYRELIARRGAPWTFDAEGCVDAFTDAPMLSAEVAAGCSLSAHRSITSSSLISTRLSLSIVLRSITSHVFGFQQLSTSPPRIRHRRRRRPRIPPRPAAPAAFRSPLRRL
jgi:hypothetical protein